MAVLEAIANYHTSIAATANQLRYIVREIQFYPDAKTPDVEKSVAYLKEQITNHYFNTFGVMPSWTAPEDTARQREGRGKEQ